MPMHRQRPPPPHLRLHPPHSCTLQRPRGRSLWQTLWLDWSQHPMLLLSAQRQWCPSGCSGLRPALRLPPDRRSSLPPMPSICPLQPLLRQSQRPPQRQPPCQQTAILQQHCLPIALLHLVRRPLPDHQRHYQQLQQLLALPMTRMMQMQIQLRVQPMMTAAALEALLHRLLLLPQQVQMMTVMMMMMMMRHERCVCACHKLWRPIMFAGRLLHSLCRFCCVVVYPLYSASTQIVDAGRLKRKKKTVNPCSSMTVSRSSK